LALDGVDIIANPSGSHHQLRKADRRVNLIQNAMRKCGGVYLFANHRGGDGDRLYFDGCATINVNGDFVSQGAQFALRDVEVLTAVVDVDQVSVYRNRIRSFQIQVNVQV
jgi:NAD+ synthase (glutamine-hydrolysing)